MVTAPERELGRRAQFPVPRSSTWMSSSSRSSLHAPVIALKRTEELARNMRDACRTARRHGPFFTCPAVSGLVGALRMYETYRQREPSLDPADMALWPRRRSRAGRSCGGTNHHALLTEGSPIGGWMICVRSPAGWAQLSLAPNRRGLRPLGAGARRGVGGARPAGQLRPHPVRLSSTMTSGL